MEQRNTMTKTLNTLYFLLFMLISVNLYSQEFVNKGDTTILYDWNKDGIRDTFFIKNLVYNSYKSGSFYSYGNLIIKLSNQKNYDLSKSIQTNPKIITDQLIKRSKYNLKNHFIVPLNIDKISKYPFLLLSLEDTVSPELTPTIIVLALDSTQTPYLFFYKRNFEFIKLMDLNNDGIKELIGRICYTQYISENIITYDPQHVYKLVDGQFVYDMDLTEYFNKKYLYGWAGPECSEEWVILKHPNLKKTRLLLLKDAIDLEKK